MIEKGRIIGVDYGHVRIGLAIADATETIASPLAVIKGSKDPHKAAISVVHALHERAVLSRFFVIGLPLLLKGEEAQRAREVRLFALALERETGIPVQFFDERFSSRQAERHLKEAALSRKKRSAYVDSISCAIVLQSFLDANALKKDVL